MDVHTAQRSIASPHGRLARTLNPVDALSMTARATEVDLKEIEPLRALFLQETNAQIRYNAYHERGWTDSYLLSLDDSTVGYGSIKGQEIRDRDTVFEFFVIRSFRKASDVFVPRLALCFWSQVRRVPEQRRTADLDAVRVLPGHHRDGRTI